MTPPRNASRQAATRVLFITPEIYPLVKTGGLGDVSAALPAALLEQNVDVRVLIPGYPQVMAAVKSRRKAAEFTNLAGYPDSRLLSARLKSGVSAYVIDCPVLYQRRGGPYLDEAGQDWPDNAVRFGLLSKVGAILCSTASPLSWRPQIAHCNDWQSGLAPAYLHFADGPHVASIMAIHNLAFQGIFPAQTAATLGLPPSSLDINGVEYFGNMSFLKAGLYYANHITTVSPTYAREIQSAPLGFGLQGLLAGRSRDVTGILNGIDTQAWNPATDAMIAQTYDADTLDRKAANKVALQAAMGLANEPEIPLFGVISRITWQKGLDLVIEAAPKLVKFPAQLVVLGSGDASLHRALLALAKANPGRIAVRIEFDEALSHLIEAGADIFLMPSRFEPCGLNQMYSQCYGTPPVVHATGGLKDSVVDCTPTALANGSATGFMFEQMTVEDLLGAAQRAVALRRDKPVWRQLQRNGIARDFSWGEAARQYREIYRSLLEG